jgi:hypothetical protein
MMVRKQNSTSRVYLRLKRNIEAPGFGAHVKMDYAFYKAIRKNI